ncbi:MAG: VWA domain-containing protein [Bacteroidetes bacterium]|nr:VWA domain-containing protein [Bacteroidota bacterium]
MRIKMLLRFFSLWILFIPIAHAQQISIDKNMWDFGAVNFWKNDTARFQIRNAGMKPLVFLPVFYNEDYRVTFSSKSLEPGETGTVSIVYYARVKGPFNREVPVYVNLRSEPIVFQVKGWIKGFDPDAQLRCPTVNTGPAGSDDISKVFTIEVRNSRTDAILQPEHIQVHYKSGKRVNLERSGYTYEMLIPPGQYMVDVRKQGFADYYAAVTLEAFRKLMVVYLDPLEESQVVVSPPPVETEPVVIREELPQKTEVPAPVESRPRRDSIQESPLKLDPRLYNANNIVMVLDVSYSMKKEDKLVFLKSAMSRMAQALRPMDKVTLITMAGTASMIFSPTWIQKPDSLLRLIEQLAPAGGTNGAAAIRLAYATALKEKIEGGNNQVIVATDGVFTAGTMSNDDLLKLVADYRNKGIMLSTIGFGNAIKPLEFLQQVAIAGGGDYLHVQNESVAQSGLVEQLKRQSRK